MTGSAADPGRTVLSAPETFNLAEVTWGIEVARRMPGGVRCHFMDDSHRDASVSTDAGFELTDARTGAGSSARRVSGSDRHDDESADLCPR